MNAPPPTPNPVGHEITAGGPLGLHSGVIRTQLNPEALTARAPQHPAGKPNIRHDSRRRCRHGPHREARAAPPLAAKAAPKGCR